MNAPGQVADRVENWPFACKRSFGVIAKLVTNWNEWRRICKFMRFESVTGMIVTTARANGFPGRRFQWLGNECQADGHTTAGCNDQPLMGGFNADEVTGIAEIIAMIAQRGQFG